MQKNYFFNKIFTFFFVNFLAFVKNNLYFCKKFNIYTPEIIKQ